MRIAGVLVGLLGFLMSLSIIGAVVGIPLMLIGLVMIVAGGRRKTNITNVVQVSNVAPDARDQDRWDRELPSNQVQFRGEEPRYVSPPVYSPAARSSRPSIAAEIEGGPIRTIFSDIENEITEDAIEILKCAKRDGFEVRYLRQDNMVAVRWGDEPEIFLYSNRDIGEFGRVRGYRGYR